ncbi:MAG: tRNA preQ1(34) S-adenosylmethionine ribosyltransferase-isomerase QueA, partial [Actinobacteria bacterium]|nr:tRNA preQ1(34) S-adenosylmethionine ribosyltransferase-isomerase QueA [Actinomycetota bacterium]
MRLDDIDYHLPAELIAQQPIEPRDSARLLVDLGGRGIAHEHVTDIVNHVNEGDVLVVNHTRVMHARLQLQRESGGRVEVLMLREQSGSSDWEALVRPGGKIRAGEVLSHQSGVGVVRMVGRSSDGDTFIVQPLVPDVYATMREIGEAPLPPYITERLSDASRYQTVYAHDERSAAAPTAGLHFTPNLLDSVRARGVSIREVELVVGLDTFKPVTVENPLDHVIHTERYCVSGAVLEECRDAQRKGNRVIAVGTTAARALESAATTGQLEGDTNLFIYPGYEWKVVDRLMTNFHMPRTTLLLMISSFVGSRWREIYSEAIDDDGVTFKSTYDGSQQRFTPEGAIATQELLGADIQMVLDVCPPLPSPPDVVRLALERTSMWAARARSAHRREDQSLFGIVQGGISESMRRESALRTAELDFDGYGIGGLSVGETREEMLPALAAALEHLPTDRPRYLMGVGDPASLVEAVGLG